MSRHLDRRQETARYGLLRGSLFKWPRGPFSSCRYHLIFDPESTPPPWGPPSGWKSPDGLTIKDERPRVATTLRYGPSTARRGHGPTTACQAALC